MQKTGFEGKEINRLVRASDDFIVFRDSIGGHTILAGYPWFTDWGRDTMIALPGLTLTTKRYAEALEMIEGFLAYTREGIIPNNFPEAGEAPMYNTSDATLWLFNAIYAYYKETGDKAAISRIYPQLMRILTYHINGTFNEIYMDDDGLLSTGNARTQLTWMDVKVNGWVVTPRHGKAVEINALFYNAMAITDYFAGILRQTPTIEGKTLQQYMACTKVAFNTVFWKEDGSETRLYDLIIDEEPIDIPRPNMIFAVSLPFPVLKASRWEAIVRYVERHFKIDSGLLTLRRDDKDFQPLYSGSILKRDGAYHRGTAWGWLLGPFLEAHYKVYGKQAYVAEAVERCLRHLDEGIYGSISEIFEGAFPHKQRGCSAQAWSVAEILRIYGDILNKK
jgi:predicted glycogen debranching enzyme